MQDKWKEEKITQLHIAHEYPQKYNETEHTVTGLSRKVVLENTLNVIMKKHFDRNRKICRKYT